MNTQNNNQNTQSILSHIDMIKCSLAVREDHDLMLIGGNAAQYFFLISYPITTVASSDDLSHWAFDGTTITLQVPSRFNLVQARKELQQFITTNSISMVCDSAQQLRSLDWLKEHITNTIDYQMLLQAATLTIDIAQVLNNPQTTTIPETTLQQLKSLCSFLEYIVLYVVRSYLGIEKIVKWALDEIEPICDMMQKNNNLPLWK